MKDRRGVSDALVMLLLLALGAVVVAGIASVLMTKTPKQTAPIATISITPTQGNVLIKHEGGDSIAYTDIQVMVYSYPSMSAATGYPKTLNDADQTTELNPDTLFNLGDVRALSDLDSGTYLVELLYIPTQTKIASTIVTVS